MWMLLKKIPATWIIIIVLGFGLWVMWGMWQSEREERTRVSNNQSVLLDQVNGIMQNYKVRDSLSAARVEALNLTVKEFKENLNLTASLVKDMGIKLNRLQSLSTLATVQRYEIHTTLRDSVAIRDSVPEPVKTIDYHSQWFDIRGVVAGNEAHLFPTSRDSISQVVERIPKRFLIFRFGTKGFRQTIVSHNPNSTITYNRYIEFRKK